MSYRHFNAVVDELEMFEGPNQRYLYLECCYRADSKGRILVPQVTLAQITGLSLRTVAGTLKQLEEKKLIEKEAHGQYQVTIKPGPDMLAVKLSARSVMQETEAQSNPLVEWLRDKEAASTVFPADYQEYNEEKQVLIYPDEKLPECVKQAIRNGQLKHAFPDKRGAIYAICFEY